MRTEEEVKRRTERDIFIWEQICISKVASEIIILTFHMDE